MNKALGCKMKKTAMKQVKRSGYLKIRKVEWIILIAKVFGTMALLDYFFYRSIWALPVLLIPGVLFGRLCYGELINRKQNEASNQFKELLLCSATELRAGYSMENALLNTTKDIKKLFGTDSFVYRLLQEIYVCRRNNCPIHEVFEQSGKAIGVDEVRDFGQLYRIAYQRSGELGEVLQRAAESIVDKLKLRNEIFMTINERLFEMKIMTLMPFLIMLYVTLTAPTYFDVMYHNLKGIMIMTVVMLIYMGAYAYARRSVGIIQRL